jgi:tol-pal system protein YbgF
MLTTFLKRGTLAMLLASFTLIAFAEDAPVYDVDSYPPQFDGQSTSADASASPPTPALQPMAQPEDAPVPVPSTAAAQPLIAADQPAVPNVPQQAPVVQQQTLQSLPMDQRVARLEQQLNNATHGDSAAKVDEMQSQMQALRGQIDELNHQIQVLQTQQKTMYTELDKRVSQKGASTSVVPSPSSDEASAETDSNTPAGTIKPKAKSKTKTAKAAETKPAQAATTTASAQPNTAEEQEIYQTAYSQIKAKKYSDAAATLQSMLQKYPSGQFAANAHYWLGELYGLMNKNEQAITEFDNVVKNYPDSPKIADAQLKLGLLYAAQFKWPDAKTSFKKVIANYPGTSSARLASEQLKQIKQTGH